MIENSISLYCNSYFQAHGRHGRIADRWDAKLVQLSERARQRQDAETEDERKARLRWRRETEVRH